MKKIGKRILCGVLEWQVRRLRIRHNFTVIAVVGSVGKTSTKTAIAKILSSEIEVRYQQGNYNDRLTVPLVVFGHSNPAMFNLLAWVLIFIKNELQIIRWSIDAVVLELGTDAPGQIVEFTYLNPDLSVVTAITPEHMEYFGSLDSVAKEELSIIEFSKRTILNVDDIDDKYLNLWNFKNVLFVSCQKKSDYSAKLKSQNIEITGPAGFNISSKINLLGKQGAKTVLLACAVADQQKINLKPSIIQSLRPFNGRMNPLPGINKSLIIDDTYNSSPAAVKAALDVVYSMKATQKIAILGSMNELGSHEEASHREVGQYCDPKKLDLVVTIGAPAERYLAKSAKRKGCNVVSFSSPYEAGDYVKKHLAETGALVLAKGSQNRVFAEESIKVLLARALDSDQLVRQSNYWLNIKQQQFGRKG